MMILGGLDHLMMKVKSNPNAVSIFREELLWNQSQ